MRKTPETVVAEIFAEVYRERAVEGRFDDSAVLGHEEPGRRDWCLWTEMADRCRGTLPTKKIPGLEDVIAAMAMPTASGEDLDIAFRTPVSSETLARRSD